MKLSVFNSAFPRGVQLVSMATIVAEMTSHLAAILDFNKTRNYLSIRNNCHFRQQTFESIASLCGN